MLEVSCQDFFSDWVWRKAKREFEGEDLCFDMGYYEVGGVIY